ncbi:hypothetical protein B296_00030720 [Ensete ventricosum]|uniref:Uncharacterized protein n=1 Tax=Ensete ventricosum TaxID=4639 RepID=A0A426XNN6_ENSVE|nr:hypothetical protein B296_00030720 [Ensete ventricosum]
MKIITDGLSLLSGQKRESDYLRGGQHNPALAAETWTDPSSTYPRCTAFTVVSTSWTTRSEAGDELDAPGNDRTKNKG